MQRSPRFIEPRANKHSQARTQLSPRPELLAPGFGRRRPGKSRRPAWGRRSGPAAKRCDVGARRYPAGLTAQRPAWGLHRPGRGRRDPVGGALGQEGSGGGAGVICPARPGAAGTGRGPACCRPQADRPGRAGCRPLYARGARPPRWEAAAGGGRTDACSPFGGSCPGRQGPSLGAADGQLEGRRQGRGAVASGLI